MINQKTGDGNYYFQRPKNPFLALWCFHKNVVKMWRVKVTPLLVFLLGLLVFLFGYLLIGGLITEFLRTHNLLNVFLIIVFPPALIIGLDMGGYLSVRKSHSAFRLFSLQILNERIEFNFLDSKKSVAFENIQSLNYNPYGEVIGNITSWFSSRLIRLFSEFLIFYDIEIDKNGVKEIIQIPLDIENIDKAIEIISSKLKKNKVNIGFFDGKPTTSYIPGVTRPELAHEPIGKWALLFLAILIFIIWFVNKFFL